MSRRKRAGERRPARGEAPPSEREAPPRERAAPPDSSGGTWAPGQVAPNRLPPRLSFPAQVGVLVAVFALVSLIADLAGAANLGVALGIGVIAFAIALVVMIVKN